MKIRINLNVILAQRNVKSKDLAEYMGISETNLSLFKSGKLKGIRFKNLEKMCEYLECEPGDIIKIEDKEAQE